MAVNSKSDDLWRKRHISLVTRHRMAMPVGPPTARRSQYQGRSHPPPNALTRFTVAMACVPVRRLSCSSVCKT